MNANTKYEIKARAFSLMTGRTAPGKDLAAAASYEDYKEREKAWLEWNESNRACIRAMLSAFDYITRE